MFQFLHRLFHRQPSSQTAPDRPRLVPTLESLEARVVPSAYINSARRLIVLGTEQADTITLQNVTLSGVAHYRVTINGTVQNFRASDVSPTYRPYLWGYGGNDTITNLSNRQVYVCGGAGNDTLRASFTGDILNGDAGNDRLIGGAGADSLFGGDNNDRLEGNGGNDSLYGDNGNDRLYGGDGDDNLYGGYDNDGLFGGAGNDLLYGQWGADRFLRHDSDGICDADYSVDAKVIFTVGNKAWTDAEIIRIDDALNSLMAATNNTKLLKLTTGIRQVFERNSSLGDGVLADNDSAGRIRVADLTFNNTVYTVSDTIIHEIGHNWDNENARWATWQSLSGWRDLPVTSPVPTDYTRARNLSNVAQPYIYLSTATFSNVYGRTNPREDFATCLQAYFANAAHGSWNAKWNFMLTFVQSLRS
ncbi:MAG: calcium-binding protein [Gemmataceae bacterium]